MTKVALPAGPTEPISASCQPDGRATETTVNVSDVALTRVPDVPVMVTVKVPVAAVPVAVSVSALVPAVLAGLKEAVTPIGKPEADRLTPALKPFCGFTAMVSVPLAP